jgi:hypothetical protein
LGELRIAGAAEQSRSNRWRKLSPEDNIPERICDTESSGESLGAVMVKVRFFNVAEVRVFEIVVVHAVVNPLFKHVAHNDAGQQHGCRIDWEKKTAWQRDQKDRHQVLQVAIYVIAIERPFMMAKVSWVKVLVREVS